MAAHASDTARLSALGDGAAFSIRSVVDTDIDCIVQHDERMTRDLGLSEDQVYGRAWFEKRIHPNRTANLHWSGLVAEVNGRPIGFAVMVLNRRWLPTVPRSDMLTLFFLSVEPAYQRQGIGSKLMAEVVAIAKSEGAKEVRLHVMEQNVLAIRFYQRLGFVFAGPLLKDYPEKGCHAYRLKKLVL